MNETMTVLQALEVTKKILNGISVPMEYFGTIGGPLNSAIGNLNVLIEWAKAPAPAVEEPKHEEDNNQEAESGENV